MTPLALVEVIKGARETCDYVAVYPHWGVEYQAYPRRDQTQIAKACIDAGADVVVGSRTPTVVGVSLYRPREAGILQSWQILSFGRSIDRSAMLEVTIDAAGLASYRFVPVYAAGGVTYPAEGGQAESVLNSSGRHFGSSCGIGWNRDRRLTKISLQSV